MRNCGFHSQQVSDELKSAIYQVEPTLCVSLQHDRDFWEEIRANTDTFLVGRLYEGGLPWRETDPVEWAERCIAMDMPYHAWATWNEPDGINNQVTPEDAQRIDEWCCKFRERLLQDGYEAVGPNIATGNWHGDAIVRHMPNLCQTFIHITRHEYSARAMWDQAPALERNPWEVPQNDGELRGWWYTLTYRGWHDAIMAAYPDREPPTFWITECGVAYGVIPDENGLPKYGDVGWRTDMALQDYINSLWWYTERLNEDEYVGGAAIYQVGGNPDWESFETIQVWPVLLDFPVVPDPDTEPDPEPDPEEPEEEMDLTNIRVFKLKEDYSGVVECTTLAEKEALVFDKYGAEFRRAKAATGQKVYRLTQIWEKTGTSSLITQVLDKNSNPMANVDVAFYWEDADDQSSVLTEHDWFQRFVHGPTNKDGDVGPGMGPGAYHGEGEGGPHATWVRDPSIPSDIFEKLGMLAGTNHDHLDHKFQLGVTGDEDPDPAPTGDLVFVRTEVQPNMPTSMFGIAYPLSISVDTRGSGTEPVGSVDDTLHPEIWRSPTTGKDYAMVEMCVDFNDDNSEAIREFTIQVYRMSDNKILAKDTLLAEPKGTAREHVISVFEFGEDTEPDPEPDLPSTIAEELDQMGDRLKELARQVAVEAPDSFTAKWGEVEIKYDRRPSTTSVVRRFFAKMFGK